MQNSTTGDNAHHTRQQADAAAGANRPHRTKGIDLPTTVCFTPRGTSKWPHTETGSRKGILPDWALGHLINEYLPEGHSAILLGARRGENTDAGFPQFQTPRHHGYGLFGHGPTGLAVLEGRPRRPKLLAPAAGREALHDSGSDLLEVLKRVRFMLVAGGTLAVATERPVPGPGFTDTTSKTIDAARRAGFTYLQHLAVIDADVTGDAITTPADAVVLADTARINGGAPVHARIHHDVLLFTNTTRKGAS